MKNSEYWQKRFTAVEADQNKRAVDTMNRSIAPAFDRASAKISQQIESWYQRFAVNNSIDMQTAKQWLSKDDLEEFKWDVKDYIKNASDLTFAKQVENASAKFHISKLEALKIRVQGEAEKAFGNELDALDELLPKQYTESYYHTAYEIQRGTGIGFDIGTIDQDGVKNLLKRPWTADKATFSDRIWDSKQKLINTVHNELTQMVLLGEAPDRTIKQIAHQMQVSKAQAGRLVITESAYISSESQKKCFNDLDVKMYEIVATLDSRTSEICQKMDGQTFPMKDYQAGVTAPPFHPWCRSCTCPYFDDEFTEGEIRASRNKDGVTVYEVPANMKYPDWKACFVDGTKDPADVFDPVMGTVSKGITDKMSASEIDKFGRHMLYGNWEEYRKKYLNYATPVTDSTLDSIFYDTVKLGSYKDVEAVNTIISTVDDLSEQFYSPLQTLKWMDKKETAFTSAFASSNHQWGYGSAEIRFNPVKLSKDRRDRIFELASTGYSVPISKGREIEYVTTHEFAHSIINLSEALPTKAKNFVQCDFSDVKNARKELFSIWDSYSLKVKEATDAYKAVSQELDSKLIINGIMPSDAEREKLNAVKKGLNDVMISRYSLASCDEFVAEAFTDAVMNDEPSEYSRMVYKVIKKYFGKER